jgi:D-sedoheptulose 7-phosphate isomerase
MTGPRPNPLADAAIECCAVDAPYTATVQELHLVGLHILCAALDRALDVGVSRTRRSIEDIAV